MFEEIIRMNNLLQAWQEFLPGKKDKPDVAEFGANLFANLYLLHEELKSKTYLHGPYKHFRINDPKPRDIHKPIVRDRLLHHAMVRVLYPYFDKKFIFDSYSSRVGKGTHCAMKRFRNFAKTISQNDTRTVWVLKCDIKKFFASIDHAILKEILAKHVSDLDTLWLLGNVIDSFTIEGKPGTGLPLGNLTSQLLVNIYMNQFDQFAKHKLKIKHYIRYADDFVFLSRDRKYLEQLFPVVFKHLDDRLKLSTHPTKCSIKTFASGIDFLGLVHFPNHRVLRTSTKQRMLRNINLVPKALSEASVISYLEMLSWGNAWKVKMLISQTR